MNIFKHLLYLLFCIILSMTTAQAGRFTFLTHYITPFTYEENGSVKGFAVDIVREMMKIMKHPEEFEMYPFKRALRTVQNTPNHALFIVAKRPERENTIKWVGPLITSGVYVYKMKGNPVKVSSLDDLKNLNAIGVGRGNADHTYLEAKGFTNLYPANNHMQSIQMLYKGRVDVTSGSELVVPEMAKQAGLDVSRIERTDLKLYDSVLFLGFSKDTPDETIAQWQQALDTLKASGKYQKIYMKYLHQ